MAVDITIATNSTLATLCSQVYTGLLARWVRNDGGVMQKESDNKITSEGTGYVGEIAVQMRDRTTLDLVEAFRMNVLQRKNFLPTTSNQQWRLNTTNDPRYYGKFLHAWDYRIDAFSGQSANTVNDWNWASDAEVDIIKYLYWASKVWPDGPYLARAQQVLADLKAFSFVTTPQGKVQTTDEFQIRMQMIGTDFSTLTKIKDGHHDNGTPSKWYAEINPSYWDFEFIAIARVLDPSDVAFWDAVKAGTAAAIYKCTFPSPIGSLPTNKGMAPNWASINSDGLVEAITSGTNGYTSTRDTNHTYDAFRWETRMGQTWDHLRTTQLAELTTNIANAFKTEWQTYGNIAAEHDHAGNRISGPYEKSMMTAGAVRAIEAAYGKNDTDALAMKSGKLVSTSRASANDGTTGNKYWNESNGQNNGAGLSYFTDMWMQQYFMQEAGLWRNYGQQAVAGDSIGLYVTDEGTSQDFGGLVVGSTPVTPPPAVTTEDCEQLFWISHKGVVLNLSDFIDGADLMAEIEGRGGLPVRQTTINTPGQSGQYTTSIVHGPRTMAVPLHLRGSTLDPLGNLSAPDPELLLDVLTKFITSMDPVGDGSSVEAGVGTLRLIRRSGDVFELAGRMIGDGLKMRQATHRFGAEVVPLVLICDDPYWYSEVETEPFYGAAPRSWFPMLRVGQPWLSSSAILGEADITVSSDVAVDPIYTAVGPGTNVSITNLDNTTETIQFLDTFPGLSAGQQLIIDTEEGTVTGPGGADWFRYLKPRSRNMFELRPGANRLEMSMAGSSSASFISISWRSRQVVPR